MGYVPFSKTGSELLFEMVGRAYERQSLIITTNLPFESWTEVYLKIQVSKQIINFQNDIMTQPNMSG